MNIRPGHPEDADALARLIDSFRAELLDDPAGAGAEHYLASVSPEAEATYLQSPRYAYLVAERDGAVIGFIARRDIRHVFHLFVAREHQGIGVARRLWEEAWRQASAASSPGSFTVNSSLGAVPVYRAFGFEPASEPVSVHGISFLPMRLKQTSPGMP